MRANINNKKNKNNGKKPQGRRPIVVSAQPWITNTKLTFPNAGIPRLVSPRYIIVSLNMNVLSLYTIIDLMPVNQGVGDNNRLGRYCRIKNIMLDFELSTQNADIFTNTRYLLVQWVPQSINQVITAASILQTPSDIHSPYNVDAAESYTILYDSKNAQSGTASVPTPTGYLNVLKKFNSGFHKNQLYANATSSSFHKIYFMAISNSSLAPFPVIAGNSTINFFT
jgi:hypothetical protein